MTVQTWLKETNLKRLDALLLLEFVLKKPREFLLAHGETELKNSQVKKLAQLEKRVSKNEPLAYILGKKEFFGYDFLVSPDVLIPRPETESLVELILNLPKIETAKILDLATGSGCIAISLKKKLAKAQITASDISKSALKIAQKNSERLEVEVNFIESNLFENISEKFNVIVSNPPYVSRDWHCSPATKFEPEQAIFAEDNGLFLVKKIISESKKYLEKNGFLALETDKRQHKEVIELAEQSGFQLKEQYGLALVFQLEI